MMTSHLAIIHDSKLIFSACDWDKLVEVAYRSLLAPTVGGLCSSEVKMRFLDLALRAIGINYGVWLYRA